MQDNFPRQVWQTEDGALHDSLEEANNHVQRTTEIDFLRKKIENLHFYNWHEPIDTHQLAEWIYDNFEVKQP